MSSQDRAMHPEPATARSAAALVNRLAAYLKTRSIYQASHRRVRDAADGLLVELDRWTDPVTWVAIRIRGDELFVAEAPVEAAGPLVPWLKSQLRDAALAGLQFGNSVDHAALAELADCIRRSTGKSAPDFTSLWPDDHAKIRPLELVFTGGHDREGRGVGGLDRGLPADDGTGSQVLGAKADEVWQLEFIQRLVTDDWIASKLAAVEQAIERSMDDDVDLRGLDLLTEIVKLLPADIQREPARVSGVVEEVLDTIQATLLQAFRDRTDCDADLTRTALAVAKKYFERRTGREEHIEPGLPTGRPEDEKIDDDLHSLVAEVRSLPADIDCRLAPADDLAAAEILRAELLGVFLYVLLHAKQDTTIAALETCFQAALHDPSEAELRVLDRYFPAAQSPRRDCSVDVDTGRVIRMLHRVGHTGLLQHRGYLSPEMVAATFPAYFAAYVDSLSDSMTDLDKLRRVLMKIPPENLEVGAEILKGDGTLQDRARVEKILSAGNANILPLAARVADIGEEWATTAATLFLRRLELPARESAALKCVDPPAYLPPGYLRELCRIGQRGEGDSKVRSLAGLVLRQFVTDATQPELQARRVHAIRALGGFPGRETLDLLHRLRRDGRFLRWSRPAREIRRAAREAVAAIQEEST